MSVLMKATSRVHRVMYRRGWTDIDHDNKMRSRLARAIYEWKHWYDWGHPVMWLVGRYDSGSAGVPRGRDLWWIRTEYVEGLAKHLVADMEKCFGCYVTTRYADVRATSGDIDWRILDLQDDGTTVKVGLWPNRPEHKGQMQPLPAWENFPVRLFLWWFIWQHKGKAQWFGLRRWAYYKALRWAVNAHSPFACGVVPEKGSGGYSHWHCGLRPWHRGAHRYVNYVWAGKGHRVEYAPKES